MIIEYTPQEQQKLNEIRLEYVQRILDITDAIDAAEGEERTRLINEREIMRLQLSMECGAYSKQCQQKRFSKIAADPGAILENAKDQIQLILETVYNELATHTLTDGTPRGCFVIENGRQVFDADFAATLLLAELDLHVEALRKDQRHQRLLFSLIAEAITDSEYTADKKITLEDLPGDLQTLDLRQHAIYKISAPVFRGKATLALANFTGLTPEINKITQKATYQTEDFKLVLQGIAKRNTASLIAADKLHRSILGEFTRTNGRGKPIRLNVRVPFDQYAKNLGYELDLRQTDGKESAAKEKARVRETRKAAKKKIDQALSIIYAASFSWKEKTVRGEMEDYYDVRILQGKGILGGYIDVTITERYANYLLGLPESQTHTGLLGIDERKPNAYFIARKMVDHYFMDSNYIRGTARRLKVSTLLSETNLPTLADLQNEVKDDSRHWERRIKEPFERALDEITITNPGSAVDLYEIKGKVLTDWEYVLPGGVPLTQAESDITDYETFVNLLVQFKVIETPEHKEQTAARLAHRAERTKALQDKKKR